MLKRPLNNTKSFFLFGPRGTGKTTWLKNSCTDSIYIDLLDNVFYSSLLSQPERLNQYIPQGFTSWIIIDEIQRVPALLNEVHRLIENKKYKFILTGSSARSLRKKGINLLAGRALTYHMYPLTALELSKDFNIEESLKYGHLPSIFSENIPEDYLKAYMQTYLREEVLHEGLTRNLGGFARFLETASFSQGSVLNISEISRESRIERKTVSNYFNVLEDLLIASFLPVFTKRAKRRLISHPKFYFFDTGIYRTIRPTGPLDSPEEINGSALETLCYQELSAVNEYLNYQYNLYYWRTSSGTEVDFILYGPKGLLAIEVKNTNRVRTKDYSGLKAFIRDYPEAKCFLLYRGEIKEYVEKIQVIPVKDFLINLKDILNTV